MTETLSCPICNHYAKVKCSMDLSHAGTNEPDDFKSYVVEYNQCQGCGFAWSPQLWGWSSDMFKREIYTPDYGRFDPGFEGPRAMNNALTVHNLLWQSRIQVHVNHDYQPRVLDWGGGTGEFATYLSGMGWDSVVSEDPFYADARWPRSAFDLITSFEVFEHHPDPRAMVWDILSYAAPGALVMFTTELVPGPLHPNWWYIAPRSGHITFYSAESLRILFAEHGWSVVSLDSRVHFAFEGTNPPPLSRSFIKVGPEGQ